VPTETLIADVLVARKGFAPRLTGRPVQHADLVAGATSLLQKRKGQRPRIVWLEIRTGQWPTARVSLPARARMCSASSGGSRISNSVPMTAT
jgi:hypothetical protein